MNEMNSLELRLRSWAPRRPSAKLKRRLLASRASQPATITWSPRWLVPATALVLVTLLLHQEHLFIGYGSAVDEIPADSSIPSGQPAAGVPGAAANPWESNLSSRSFEWTNHSGFTSSVTSFLPGKAN